MNARWLSICVLLASCSSVEPPPTGVLLSFSPLAPASTEVRLTVRAGEEVIVDAARVPELPRDTGIQHDEAFLLTFADRWAGREVQLSAIVGDGGDIRGIGETAVTLSLAEIQPVVVAVNEAWCGDGRILGNEACDPGAPVAEQHCDTECKIVEAADQPEGSCGNGVLDDGEACDMGQLEGAHTCNEIGFLTGATVGAPTCTDQCRTFSCGAPIDTPEKIMEAIDFVSRRNRPSIMATVGIQPLGSPYDFDGVTEILGIATDNLHLRPVGGASVTLRNVAIRIEGGKGNIIEGLHIVPPDRRRFGGLAVPGNDAPLYAAIEVMGEGHIIRSNRIELRDVVQPGAGIASAASAATISANYVSCGERGVASGIVVGGRHFIVDQNAVTGACTRGLQAAHAPMVSSTLKSARVDHNSVHVTDGHTAMIVGGTGLCMRYNIAESPPVAGIESVALVARALDLVEGCLDGSTGATPVHGNLILGHLVCRDELGDPARCGGVCAPSTSSLDAPCVLMTESMFASPDTLCLRSSAVAAIDHANDLGYDRMASVPTTNCFGCFMGRGPDIGAREVGSTRTWARDDGLVCE